MKLLPTEPFMVAYRRLPHEIQRLVDKQLLLLLANPRHPSLHMKKMHSIRGAIVIFELRVTRGYRLTLQISDEFYILRVVGTHDVLRRP